MPATAAQNFISAARHSGARLRCKDPEKTSVCRFGITRTAFAAASSVSAFQPPPRAFHAPRLSDVADPRAILGARSGRKRSSSDWSNSTRHRTPAARSGRAAMVTHGAGPRRLCRRIVRYAECPGMTMCARAWQVNARETRSRCVATNDAIKSRSSAGSRQSGGDLEAMCFPTGEGDGTTSSWMAFSK